MNSKKLKGTIQLAFVVTFILGSSILSLRIARSDKQSVDTHSTETSFIVETETIVPKPYQVTFTTTGIVQSRSSVQIVPQVSGRIIEVHPGFYTGGTFQADEVLFQIEPAEYELEVQRMEAEVARSETALLFENAEARAARAEWIQQNGNLPTPPLAAREPQLKEAQANVNAAKANLANAKLRLERSSFRLPKSGSVITSHITVGQHVQVGVSYGEVFYKDSLEVTASLSSRELQWLSQTIDPVVEFDIHKFGKIIHSEGQMSRHAVLLNTSTRFGSGHFEFINQPANLLPGLFVDVTIKGPVLDDISLLSETAVQQDGIVWVLGEGNRLHATYPDIVHRTDDWIAVRGLDGTLPVVTSPIRGATEGSLATTRSREQYNLAYNPAEDGH
jgi:RND family efflux transporter MFP subunit